MEAFEYQALDQTGRTVRGVVRADSARLARAQLRMQGLLPSSLDKVAGRETRGVRRPVRRIPASELAQITRQLATLLESGLTLEQSLNALIDETASETAHSILAEVKGELLTGHSLATALASHEASFPDFYRALVHAGEEAGALPAVLAKLASYLDARETIRHKTGLALLYPALVTLVAAVIVTGLLIYVVPQVVQVFQNARQGLPWLTLGLIWISDTLRGGWPYLLGAAVFAAGLLRLGYKNPGFRLRCHALLLRLPGLGRVLRAVDASRFASTLAILTGGGVPLLSALATGSRVMSNQVLRNAAGLALERVREGVSLARALAESREFPPVLVHLVASGEASGRLPAMLQRASDLQSQSLERRLAVFVTLLEPALILAMGGLVLLIVLAILLPIIEINQLVR